jgi:hypothetical protein
MRNSGIFQKTKALIAMGMCAVLSATVLYAQNSAQNQKLSEYDGSDGYAVLSASLDHEHSTGGPVLLISSATSSGMLPDSFESCRKIPDEFKSAARDFKDKNKQSWRLLKKFTLPFKYEFADQVKKDTAPAPGPGEQELPPGFYAGIAYVVSAVGFDTSHNHAIAYVAGAAGSEASGGYHLLVRNKYGWGEVHGSPVCEWMTLKMQDRTNGAFS